VLRGVAVKANDPVLSVLLSKKRKWTKRTMTTTGTAIRTTASSSETARSSTTGSLLFAHGGFETLIRK
jgi:predicted solute-binding protein